MHEISAAGARTEIPQTDPDYAPTVEVFDHLGYDELYRGVMLLKPEVLTAGRQAWQNSASGMADAVQQAHAQIRSAIADGWRGSAAALASETVQAFEALGQNLSDVMAEVGRRLGQANDAAETLRASVAQPVGASPDLEAALLDPKHATVNADMQKTAESVRLDAVRVMNAVYTGAFIPTGNNVPGFPVGGMYPNPQVAAPNSGKPVPGGGAADLVTPGVPPAPNLQTAVQHEDSQHRRIAAQQQPQRAAETDTPRTDAAVPVAPASSAPPVSAAAPASVAVQPAATQVAPAAVVIPQEHQAAPTTAAATPVVATTTAGASTTPQSTDGKDGKKDKGQQGDPSPGNASADTASGMGAGIVGGLAGGAVAFGGDTPRSGPSIPRAPKRSHDDEYDDEEYYPDFDGPTYLELPEPDTELVGHLNPTTPPVVGEWAGDDE
ncbi:WXG100 family type VII secretion target [Nocardia alni]|uniref:WXG100 family type VII secretion target n=1 Tax=Nocardia alni TaxID=2815723 RepID=UPI001C241B60|nr:WXG100 family type VII secretion target [Nocardia alni]